VRIPRNNATAIRDSYGNWTQWTFPDPCGIEVGLGHVVRAGSEDAWIGYCPDATHTYLDTYTDAPPRSLEVDRDASLLTYDRYYYYSDPGACMADNRNELANGPESYDARHLGAVVYGEEGRLCVQPLWAYGVEEVSPQRVILNNADEDTPYPSTKQWDDGLMLLTARGWSGMTLRLTVVDPPDFSPYIPWGTWTPKPGKTASLPYVANDNEVWADSTISDGDWGLSAYSSGPWTQELEVTPGADHRAVFWLRMPPRYAGDNVQIATEKVDPKTNQVVPEMLCSLSPVFTSWKRVFIEKDRMFRRGGVLRNDSIPGQSSVLLYKNSDDSRWDNLQEGDKIAIFDSATPFEGPHDEAFVASGGIDPNYPPAAAGEPHRVKVDLVTTRGGTTPYLLTRTYSASLPDTAFCPNFASGSSAAVGVIQSADGQITDTSTNQINGAGSAFYDADMRDVKQPFTDAYVEVIGQRDGAGAVPYVAGVWFDWAHQSVSNFQSLHELSNLWFANKQLGANPPELLPKNHFHLLGASDAPATGIYADTFYVYDWTYVYGDRLTATFPDDDARRRATQWVTAHELVHQFNVNPDDCDHHDGRMAWCDAAAHCQAGGTLAAKCLMNVNPTDYASRLTSGICRLCLEDLLTGAQDYAGELDCNGIAHPWSARDGAVRTDTDPQ
jgi:hypothetical protein